MSSKCLTDHLLSHSPEAFKAATTHPFLSAAGTSSLPKETLLAWLSQDRIYALSYVPFIGSLLSKTRPITSYDRKSTLEWQTTHVLIDALTNIRREIDMFEDLLRKHFDWGNMHGQTEDKPREETKEYMDLFKDVTNQGRVLLNGMTVLWATEKCYLEAWKYANSCGSGEQGTGDVVRDVLIPNWTSDGFGAFVNCIGGLVDNIAANMDVWEGSEEWKECEQWWEKVLQAELHFWPDVHA